MNVGPSRPHLRQSFSTPFPETGCGEDQLEERGGQGAEDGRLRRGPPEVRVQTLSRRWPVQGYLTHKQTLPPPGPYSNSMPQYHWWVVHQNVLEVWCCEPSTRPQEGQLEERGRQGAEDGRLRRGPPEVRVRTPL